MAMIYAKPGQEGDTARKLLALADHPRDVGTNTDNGFAFVVPESLYERWLGDTVEVDETPAGVEKASRRPGRPRKQLPEAESE